jgi:hypothetical protein
MNIKEIDDAILRAAIARFESIHGAIEEVCPQFIGAIVEFTQEGLKGEDNFTDWQGLVEIDNAQVLVHQIYKHGWAVKYKDQYKRIEDEYEQIEDVLHPIILGDEIDVLMVEIVRAIITQEKPQKINRIQRNSKKLRPFGLSASTVPDDFDAPLPEDILSAFEGK